MAILITGAKRIGTYIAKNLIQEGFNVAIVYNKTNVCTELKNAFCIQRDLSKDNLEDIPNIVFEHFGKLDAFLHLASPYYPTFIENFDIKDYQYYQKIVVESFLSISIKAFDIMMKNQEDIRGRIVAFGDWAINTPYKNYLPYFVSKGALHSAVITLAKEFAPYVLVNAIAPGPVLKPEDMPEKEWQSVIKNSPLQREVGLEDIYMGVEFFLKIRSITGTILPIDSGRHIKGVSS